MAPHPTNTAADARAQHARDAFTVHELDVIGVALAAYRDSLRRPLPGDDSIGAMESRVAHTCDSLALVLADARLLDHTDAR
jgi:hypothetical protein